MILFILGSYFIVESYCESIVEYHMRWIEKWQKRNESLINLIKHSYQQQQAIVVVF
jgi:hypothetical protein